MVASAPRGSGCGGSDDKVRRCKARASSVSCHREQLGDRRTGGAPCEPTVELERVPLPDDPQSAGDTSTSSPSYISWRVSGSTRRSSISGNSDPAREATVDMPQHTSAGARGGSGSDERLTTSRGVRRASAGPKQTLRDRGRACPGIGNWKLAGFRTASEIRPKSGQSVREHLNTWIRPISVGRRLALSRRPA